MTSASPASGRPSELSPSPGPGTPILVQVPPWPQLPCSTHSSAMETGSPGYAPQRGTLGPDPETSSRAGTGAVHPMPPTRCSPPTNPRKDHPLVCTTWTSERAAEFSKRNKENGPRPACLRAGLAEGRAPAQGPRAAPEPALASVCTLHASAWTFHACDPSSQHTLGSVLLFSYFLFY